MDSQKPQSKSKKKAMNPVYDRHTWNVDVVLTMHFTGFTALLPVIAVVALERPSGVSQVLLTRLRAPRQQARIVAEQTALWRGTAQAKVYLLSAF